MTHDDEIRESEEFSGRFLPPDIGCFATSRLKVKWAKQHINDVDGLLAKFASSEFYTVSIDGNVRQGTNFLRFDIDESPFPFHDAALIVGDVLHNLRSALDLLYYGVVIKPTKWTRFPIADTRDRLVNTIDAALKNKQISSGIYDLLLDGIKPYHAGNYTLWALHDLNIRDKHQLLIPVLKFLRFDGVSLEDDEQRPINEGRFYLMDASSRVRLPDDMTITLKDKGKASATVLFDLGTAFQNEAVIPSLSRIAEEVERTVEAFELL